MAVEDKSTFLPTTQIWDSTSISALPGSPDEMKQLIIKLYENINIISEVLNKKDTGIYDVNEYICGQVFYPTGAKTNQFRVVYRKVVTFGALPAVTKAIAHGITFNNTCKATRIYGAATDLTSGSKIPLPYASPILADNIELWLDNTNVNMKTGKNRSAYTECDVIIEYVSI
jgi:hypothetical protein